MAEYLIKDTTLTEIADAVRAKTKKTDTILVSDLAEEIAGISTGVELNFDVVGGTTKPSSPSANTIWVNTSNTITSWIFSATQPSSPTEGMVWISIGTSSLVAFNALKRDGISVYPISAKQYVSGAWVDKTAKSYQGGKWKEWWNGILYDNGNEYTEFTGGWSAGAIGSYPSNYFTKEIDHLRLYPYHATQGVAANCWHEKLVDLTQATTVYAIITLPKNDSNAHLGIFRSVEDAQKISYNLTSAVARKLLPTGTKITVSLDVSGYDGAGVVAFSATSGALPLDIYKVWTE